MHILINASEIPHSHVTNVLNCLCALCPLPSFYEIKSGHEKYRYWFKLMCRNFNKLWNILQLRQRKTYWKIITFIVRLLPLAQSNSAIRDFVQFSKLLWNQTLIKFYCFFSYIHRLISCGKLAFSYILHPYVFEILTKQKNIKFWMIEGINKRVNIDSKEKVFMNE